MMNDNLQEITNSALGTNAYNPTVPDEQIQQLPQEESYFGRPERYDYSEVQLPENYYYDEKLLNEFNELASKYNLSQKGANELMSMAVKLTQLMGNNYSKTMAEQQRQKVEDYKYSLITDREIGGANFEKTMGTANLAYSQFADDEVQAVLAQTGLNCHPKIVKMFYNIGKRMQNDNLHGVSIASAPKENREDILFPTM